LILPDSSIWINHLRRPDAALDALLKKLQILSHPFVAGEVALGSIANRHFVLAKLDGLSQCRIATPDQTRMLIETGALWGRGIGFVDASLLASAAITPGAMLWTNDRRLRACAERLGLAYVP
jgi:predicted nucleic acid-binding protein